LIFSIIDLIENLQKIKLLCHQNRKFFVPNTGCPSSNSHILCIHISLYILFYFYLRFSWMKYFIYSFSLEKNWKKLLATYLKRWLRKYFFNSFLSLNDNFFSFKNFKLQVQALSLFLFLIVDAILCIVFVTLNDT
jgi:hypothetical protein